ncbi:transcription cofactor HES-6-like [Pygocentrus nattereri]|uniref:transcription cofactor HES-6-like n=1 Tax=Pygocentrus nattereri TaxID=42514 RepID=UPI000814B142|nr:transcription cofactor HES-6-like [Pygocentrus nattereri]
MAPFRSGFSLEEETNARGDRKTRKPLVEKKRRARINESLQELRNLITETELQAKMENAEVLELTVKRVENILQHQSHEANTVSHEASERFAAGYIQCMHEVHTFVSTCPGIDATVAAELLNHLLECMPLHEESLPEALLDLMADQSMTSAILSPARATNGASAALSPNSSSSSPSSSEDLCSDSEETDGESSPVPAEEEQATITYNTSMWRPW